MSGGAGGKNPDAVGERQEDVEKKQVPEPDATAEQPAAAPAPPVEQQTNASVGEQPANEPVSSTEPGQGGKRKKGKSSKNKKSKKSKTTKRRK
jgi:hypothetical protein